MLDVVNSAIALVVVIRLIIVADSMSGTTRHCFRFAVAMLAIMMLAFAIWPLYGDWPDWMDTLFALAIGCYIFTDKRSRIFRRDLAA